MYPKHIIELTFFQTMLLVSSVVYFGHKEIWIHEALTGSRKAKLRLTVTSFGNDRALHFSQPAYIEKK